MTEQTLAALLAQEIAEVGHFVELLREEQSLLTEGTLDRLSEITAAKTAIVDRLTPLGAERNRLLAAQRLSPDAAGVAAWASQNGPQAEQLRFELVSLASEARELNQTNGQLIAMRLAHTQGALHALTEGKTGSGLYDRGGLTPARTGYRLIDSA